ncbi:MAG TPA: diacylglycerol kinase [Armatimonadota bacterium]|nr:diacylglycerol kinase [Armatimonadota bacterium]
MRNRSLLDSSRNAVDGLLHVLRQDWHMRFICLVGAFVMLFSALLSVSRLDVLLLLLAISMVVLAEVINRAIEVVVDLVSPEYHPLAKAAKDVGGAGVLVATVFGLVVALGVFASTNAVKALQGLPTRPEPHILHVGLVGIVTVVAAVILGKLWGGHGSLTRGGLVSAHSALGFFCFVSICFLTPDIIVRALGFALAVLVAQSRVDAGIHTVREVIVGTVVALVLGTGLYGLLAMRAGG